MTRKYRILLAAVLVMAIPLTAFAVDRQIGFSGFLTNNLGTMPIADNTYSITFAIYTVASGGVAIWSETQSVTTVTGEFTVMLGSVTPLTVEFASDTNYFLGITVSPNPEMSPRKKLLYVPYAFREEKVEVRTTDPTSPVTGQMWLIVP